jgi:hypothetical protein
MVWSPAKTGNTNSRTAKIAPILILEIIKSLTELVVKKPRRNSLEANQAAA